MRTHRQLPAAAPGADPRFSDALIADVAERLETAGFPPLVGADVDTLAAALAGVLYGATAPLAYDREPEEFAVLPARVPVVIGDRCVYVAEPDGFALGGRRMGDEQ